MRRREKYQRKPVTVEGIRSDFNDHAIIRGAVSIRLPGGLPMTALIRDAADDSLQQYLLGVKSLLKRYFMKAGWAGGGDIRVCDLGIDPTKEVAFHRATYFAQDVARREVYVSLPKDRADAAIARLGISKVVDEL